MQVIAIDLSNRNIAKLGKTKFHWIPQFCIRNLFSVQAAALYNEFYIVGTHNSGIYLFHINKEKTEKISSSTCLPSNYVQSITCINGIIYASLGEIGKDAYIISYDIKTKKMKLLASSQGLEKLSPFDNLINPFHICSMIADPSRNRVLMLLTFQTGVNPRKVAGLWDYNVKTKKWRQLLKIPFAFKHNMHKSEDKILIFSHKWCIQFCPTTNKPELIYSKEKKFSDISPINSKLIGLKNDISSPFILTEKWLFSASPFTCVSKENGLSTLLPYINNQDDFQPVPVFEKTQNNQLLIGDGKSLFIIDLKDDNK